MTTIGADPADFDAVLGLAKRYDGIYAALGIHPHIADRTDTDLLARIAELAEAPGVVAIGETGLDYHYDNAPRDAQRRSFYRHLELAADLALPLIVHSRTADLDTAAVLRDAGSAGLPGVLHCFDGGAVLLDAALEAGWFISFSGMVTFRNYAGADLLRATPDDRLLIETDSPYLAPVPMRGKRNEPAFVRHTAMAVAEMRGESFEEIAATTTRNACRFYGIEE
jgi:TatD DNase family protein